MKAWVEVKPPGIGGADLTFDALLAALGNNGVQHGINEAELRERAKYVISMYKQPALVEQLSRPTGDLPAMAAPELTAVMIRIRPGADPAQVSNIISSWGDVTVFTKAGQQDLLLQGMVDKARRQLGMFRALLTIIAAIIMALILYTLTLDKLHSIALLKLIGAPNRVILGLILQQAIVLGGVGYGIAYLVGQKLFPYFPRRVVLTAAEIDATLQGEPDFLAFSEALSTAFVARRAIAVRNPAGNRIKHSIDNALDCYVALRDAWQTELVGDWDPEIQGDAAYWRGAHPAVELPGEDRLGPAELRAALRAEARAYVDEAMEIVAP